MSTRQRSDNTENYKASFIYITPSILAKISFILGPISITPIVYKIKEVAMVSGLNFSWFSHTLYFSTICF
jgi:hypothetical protein